MGATTTIARQRQDRGARKPWLKRFFNPARLTCTNVPQDASRALTAVLEARQAVGTAAPEDLAAELLSVIVGATFSERGAFLLLEPTRRQPMVVGGRDGEADGEPAFDGAMLDFVLDTGAAVAGSHDDGPVAVVPLRPLGELKVVGAVVLVRDRRSVPFSACDLEVACLLGALTAADLRASQAPALQAWARQRERPPARAKPAAPAPARRPAPIAAPAVTVTVFSFERPGRPNEPKTPVRVPLTIERVFGPDMQLPSYLTEDE